MMLRVATILGLGLLGLAAPAEAADPREVALAISQGVIVPGYRDLTAAFDRQRAAWEQGCGDVEALRAAYNQAADAWAAVEHVRFGPISREQRSERIAFWPDPRNATERGLAALIAAPDESGLAAERISTTSVAVQGLPALERLLYREGGGKVGLDDRRCAIGRAISSNLASIGQSVSAEWTAPRTGQLAQIEATATSAETAAADKSAATQMLTDLATLFMVVADRKIAPLYGVKGKPPNPKAAEAWRSGRSRRNIDLNLKAAAATARSLVALAPQEASELARRVADAEVALAQNEGNPPGFAAFAGVKVAQYVAIQKLPEALDVPLGFNSLDGD